MFRAINNSIALEQLKVDCKSLAEKEKKLPTAGLATITLQKPYLSC